MTESHNKKQEEYLKLHFIQYMQSERIPIFEAYLSRSNAVVQMPQKLLHLNLPIGEGAIFYNKLGWENTGYGLNMGNIYYEQSVTENHTNLV